MSFYSGPAAVVILFKRREKIRRAVCPLMSLCGGGAARSRGGSVSSPLPQPWNPLKKWAPAWVEHVGFPFSSPSLARQITWNQSSPKRNHRNDFSFINHPYHPSCRRSRQDGVSPEKYFRPMISRATPKPPPPAFSSFPEITFTASPLPKEGSQSFSSLPNIATSSCLRVWEGPTAKGWRRGLI